jgi:polyisoprenoid-binding protein YceI
LQQELEIAFNPWTKDETKQQPTFRVYGTAGRTFGNVIARIDGVLDFHGYPRPIKIEIFLVDRVTRLVPIRQEFIGGSGRAAS